MRGFVFVALLAVAGSGEVRAQDAAAGEKVFGVCKACHQIGAAAKNAVGPNLTGVIGRKAGTMEGFKYSEAMTGSGITWDEAALKEYLADPKKKVPGNKMVFMGLKDVFLLLVGCIMDIYTATVVIVPLLAPLATRYGIHPVHLAIIFLANLAIGYSTPPVGMNLFVAAMRLNRPLIKLAAASLALMGLMLAVLVLITYWPALSLVLVK